MKKATEMRAYMAGKLRPLRSKRGLTQSELADIAKVSQGLISKAERGERSLPAEAIERIAEALDLDAELLSPTLSPRDAFKALRTAWNAYSVAHRSSQRLGSDVIEMTRFLRVYKDAIAREITLSADSVEDEIFKLETWTADSREADVRRAIPVPKEAHKAYRLLPGGPVTSRIVEEALELAAIAAAMDEEDRSILWTLARRLASCGEVPVGESAGGGSSGDSDGDPRTRS